MSNSRRQFLAAGSAVVVATAAAAAAPRAWAQSAPFTPSQRYPDPLIRHIDPSFGRYRIGLAKVERIASGMR
jgi:gluconolactonase